MRSAHTPDCLVTDCDRAAFKFGVCRKHHALLPHAFKLAAMGYVFETHAANNKRAARLARQLERRV
jgi:hypothetical protein